jgi:deoxyribonuclease V
MKREDVRRPGVAQAVALQRRLAARVRIEPFPGLPRRVAGVDVSASREGTTLWGGIVVFDREAGRIIESRVASLPAEFPYVPGLLSFREIPVLIKAGACLRSQPEVVLVDGQGRAHPRRLGIATHLGLVWDVPTIGCAKSRLVGETRGMPGEGRGCRRLLYDRGEPVGVLLRTRAGVKPLWISPGHRMDIASAARLVLACSRRYRIPEPIRAAHQLVGDAMRGQR